MQQFFIAEDDTLGSTIDSSMLNGRIGGDSIDRYRVINQSLHLFHYKAEFFDFRLRRR